MPSLHITDRRRELTKAQQKKLFFPMRDIIMNQPFTYNPAREGSHRERYYRRMQSLRDEWRAKTGLAGREGTGARGGMSEDERNELEALASIPRI